MTTEQIPLQKLPDAAPDVGEADEVVKRTATEEVETYLKAKRDIELAGATYELDARKSYGKRIFWLVVAWLVVVLGIVILAGYADRPIYSFQSREIYGPKISDGVLIALITGMSVNVIGLLAIVVNYLFPKRGSN